MPLMFHKVIKFFKNIFFDHFFQKRLAKKACQHKSYPGTERKSDCRIDSSPKRSIKITADKACQFSRNRSRNNLYNLKQNKDEFIVRMV